MHRARGWLLPALALFAASTTASSQSQDRAAPPSILISRQLAESRGLRIGDNVLLSADRSGNTARPFRITGVYEPTPDPMRFAQQRLEARLHLPDLLTLTADRSDPSAAESITSINVALENRSDAGAFSRDVTARLPTVTARPTNAPDERTTTFVVVERFHLAIAIVTVVGSAVFLLALMVMLVDERRGTVGTLRLLGFTRQRILIQVLAEGALIAIAGAVGGILFAFAMQDAFNRYFQWRYDTTLIFLRITPAVVWRSLSMAVPLGIAASLIASWTLLRRQILALVRR
jgi:ABC-type lipoprotein release transport system permease subunit